MNFDKHKELSDFICSVLYKHDLQTKENIIQSYSHEYISNELAAKILASFQVSKRKKIRYQVCCSDAVNGGYTIKDNLFEEQAIELYNKLTKNQTENCTFDAPLFYHYEEYVVEFQ